MSLRESWRKKSKTGLGLKLIRLLVLAVYTPPPPRHLNTVELCRVLGNVGLCGLGLVEIGHSLYTLRWRCS